MTAHRILPLVVFSALLSSPLPGQNSSVPWSTFSGGFGVPASSISSVRSVLGQPLQGESTRANTLVISGFLADTLFRGTIVSVPAEPQIPLAYGLLQNYPNPFNPLTTIQFSVPERIHVTMKVYNILGQEVTVLVDEQRDPGVHEVRFDATTLSSGAYFYLLSAGNFVELKKLMILK